MGVDLNCGDANLGDCFYLNSVQPCEWLFNGAMCARRTADGGMKILVGGS